MSIDRPRIMIVEDIRANVRFLEKHLSSEYECLVAFDGKDALPIIRAEQPDLVLLDIEMPEMDGFEVCRRLKADEQTMGIPIIFLTSLTEMEDETKGLELGAVDYVTKPFRLPIVKARIRNHIELKRTRDLLEQQAFIDGLTRIPNRRRFDEVLEREWGRALRNGSILSLILMDIDFFKRYNDNYGHRHGDLCLQKIGAILSKILHRPSDFCARYGGEEFVVVLPETDTEGAVVMADQIRDELAAVNIPHEFSDVAPHVSFSQGVASVLPSMELSPELLVEAADKALYSAKESGRNRAAVYSGDVL